MKNSSLVGHLVEVFERAYNPSAPVDRTLDRFFRSHRYLGARDRRFVADHLYDMLRHIKLIEFQIRRLQDADLLHADLAQAHSLVVYLVYAVLRRSQTVAEVMEDTAVLRQKLPEQSPSEGIIRWVQQNDFSSHLPEDPVRRDAILYSMPEFLIEEWVDVLGEEAHELVAAMNTQAPLTLRVNSLKASPGTCMELLRSEGVETDCTEISPDGLIMSKRANLPSLSVFRSGMIEVQDEGSQVVSYLVNPSGGESVVDACAGAGGKGLHMAAMMNNKGKIISIEPDRGRRKDSATRAQRSGADIIQTFHPDDSRLNEQKGRVDRVLVDAPCSGSGVFRRSPGTKLFLSVERVNAYAEEQRSILSHYASFVRPGGRLVYATCSLCASENEDVVNSFLAAHPVFTVVPVSEILAVTPVRLEHQEKFLRLYPHRHGTDGFFAAVFQRR